MTNNRPQRACLWLRVSTDSKGQDPALQLADLEGVYQQRDWQIVKVYEVEESAFGRTPRQQFQNMLEDARRGKFDVLVVWSLDRFSREGEWSVSRIMAALQDWNIRFYSYNEPFLDTTGPFAGFLIPLFAWLARQESIRKGKAVRLGMEKARARGQELAGDRRGPSADQIQQWEEGQAECRVDPAGVRWRLTAQLTTGHCQDQSARRGTDPASIHQIKRTPGICGSPLLLL
jgi:DNA invertase Pin-like site-specific DNA recombinase